jgi:hypothetical protein
MSESDLGTLEKVDPRTVWPDEPRDFTPWLSEEENLARLAETIGIELELEGTEQNVGPFSADILCKDTVEDRYVLIENQLDRTDHTHLGQLLTYAAGLDAVTIIWIARNVRDQHRAALDWLNNVTEEKINFFGIEIELWKIADSPAAPKFSLVSKPNDWSKIVSRMAKRDGELTETQQLKLEYWTALAEYLDEHDSRVRPRTPQPRSWMSFAVGRSGCHVSANMNTRAPFLRVLLYLKNRADGRSLFHLLKEEQEAIESEIGEPLEWLERPDKESCFIQYKWEADPTDRENWSRQHGRIRELADAFHRVFSPRLKQLDPADWDPSLESE